MSRSHSYVSSLDMPITLGLNESTKVKHHGNNSQNPSNSGTLFTDDIFEEVIDFPRMHKG